MEGDFRQGQWLSPVTRGGPSFAAPIYASVVEVEDEELALIWFRRRAAD
jgi:uncharacterized protein (DUF736 family)|tara:strand:+ start:5120 stop:5266 length:147 start_codon:yes stop_codon:yes gene_type:complete